MRAQSSTALDPALDSRTVNGEGISLRVKTGPVDGRPNHCHRHALKYGLSGRLERCAKHAVLTFNQAKNWGRSPHAGFVRSSSCVQGRTRGAATHTVAHRQIPTEVYRPRIPTESVGRSGAWAAEPPVSRPLVAPQAGAIRTSVGRSVGLVFSDSMPRVRSVGLGRLSHPHNGPSSHRKRKLSQTFTNVDLVNKQKHITYNSIQGRFDAV